MEIAVAKTVMEEQKVAAARPIHLTAQAQGLRACTILAYTDIMNRPPIKSTANENAPHNASADSSTGVVDPDANILTAMAQGDSDALGTLMDRHLNSIKALAWYMLGDELSAEDVAQEVFLKSWVHAEKWEPGRAKFITWMRRVTTNTCLDRLRKKREILSDTVPEMVDDTPLADAGMIENELGIHVRKAILELPDRQRAAITLCHYQNLSQKEAAGILEISVDAYESLLARGRRSLRKALENDKQALLSGYGK